MHVARVLVQMRIAMMRIKLCVRCPGDQRQLYVSGFIQSSLRA